MFLNIEFEVYRTVEEAVEAANANSGTSSAIFEQLRELSVRRETTLVSLSTFRQKRILLLFYKLFASKRQLQSLFTIFNSANYTF